MKKVLKILGLMFLGYQLVFITHFPYDNVISRQLSPNRKYELKYYSWSKGIIYYNCDYHITIIDKTTGKHVFYTYVGSGSKRKPKEQPYWQGDNIIVPLSDIYTADGQIIKKELDSRKTIFHFKEGYATK